MPDYVVGGTVLALATGLPLAWKWQLGALRACVCLLAVSMLVAVALTGAGRWLALNALSGTLAMWGATVLAALAGLLIVFFRDPDRPAPSREDVIVSPADGRVVYVRSVEPGQLPLATKKGRTYPLRELAGTTLGDGGAMAIGISMTLSDVHVNRAPVGGRVRLVEHAPGTFGSLRNPEMLLSNERVTTVIEDGDLEVAVVQIASRLVRRIVTFVSEGDLLGLGQRIGAIRFGSQVDLIITASPRITVAVQAGDRVVAGQTIIALISTGPGAPVAASSTGGSVMAERTSSVSAQADRAAGQLEVIDLDPEDRRWGDFVAGQPGALPYHHPAWSRVLQETFGYRLAALGCTDATGRLTGVLPLAEKKSLLAGMYLASLPNTPTTGPVAVDRASLGALLGGAAARVDHSAASWLQLKVEGPALDGLASGFSGGSWAPSYIVDLPADPEQLRFGGSRHKSHRSAGIRRNVRQAARLGVAVREASSLGDVRRWYRLYLANMRAHSLPPRPLRLFEVIWDILTPLGLARWLLAERSSARSAQLLAGNLFFAHNSRVIAAFSGRDPTQLEYRPNDAIHWSAITQACRAGHRWYDFGEVASGNDGLRRFKEKWGAVPVDLYRYHYPRQREVELGVLAPGHFLRTAQWAWRRLPLRVTAALGGLIYGRL